MQESAVDLDHHDVGATKAKIKRQPAALPWMRSPVALDGGTAVPLAHVRGLHAQLIRCLEAGAEHVSGLSLLQLACLMSRDQPHTSHQCTGLNRPHQTLDRVDAAMSGVGIHEQLKR